MKLLSTILLFLCINVYSQDSDVTIDSIIEAHIQELRTIIGKDPYVFIDFNYNLPNNTIRLEERDTVILHGIDAKRLKKNKEYFFVRFTLKYDDNDKLMLMAVNFRVTKISRKSVSLVNLGNGSNYKL